MREQMDTPVLTLDYDIMEENLKDMAAFARENSLKLSPHSKSHKTPELAKKQLELGASKITVAKLGEAEVMADHGIKSILVAYPIVTEVKMRRLYQLTKKVSMEALVDTAVGIERLGEFFGARDSSLPVYLKIDTGLHRCGAQPTDEAIDLARLILETKGLSFKGLLTHAGHVYGAEDRKEVETIAREEGEVMVKLKERLEREGIHAPEVSVGSTPTVKIAGRVEGVTEIRPGNYIFHDAMQISLGVVGEERCALRVKATVVSRHPDRAIIDAGSKALGLDRGAHGKGSLQGHGQIVGRRDCAIHALSEEHGILRLPLEEKGFTVGEEITIIPNHACSVVNLFPLIYLFQREAQVSSYHVSARGKLQ